MPLAHILAPQLIRKAQEIEDAIGPPRPVASGYLQASAPAPAPPAHERALKDLRGTQQRPDTVFKNAARQAIPKQAAKSKIKPIPNAASPAKPGAPVPSGDNPIGMDEHGRSIYASEPAPKAAKKKKGERTVIQLPLGPVGMNESGQAVNSRGAALGYLRSQDPNVRTLERHQIDVPVGERNAYDQFGTQVLQQRFGEHLKAMQDNRDADGMPTDKFPSGYFSGMDKKRKEEIEKGVARLREFERGTPI